MTIFKGEWEMELFNKIGRKLYVAFGYDKYDKEKINNIKKFNNVDRLKSEKELLDTLKWESLNNIAFAVLISLLSPFVISALPASTLTTIFRYVIDVCIGVIIGASVPRLLTLPSAKKEIDELIKKETAKEKHEKDNLIDELAIKEVRMPKHDYSLSYSNGKNVNVSFNDLVNTLSVEELKVLKNKMDVLNDYFKYAKANRERGLYNEDTISTELNDDVTLSVRYKF